MVVHTSMVRQMQYLIKKIKALDTDFHKGKDISLDGLESDLIQFQKDVMKKSPQDNVVVQLMNDMDKALRSLSESLRRDEGDLRLQLSKIKKDNDAVKTYVKMSYRLGGR